MRLLNDVKTKKNTEWPVIRPSVGLCTDSIDRHFNVFIYLNNFLLQN